MAQRRRDGLNLCATPAIAAVTVYKGMPGMMENACINVQNRSHTITAEVDIPVARR
jgi:hypothetical protein